MPRSGMLNENALPITTLMPTLDTIHGGNIEDRKLRKKFIDILGCCRIKVRFQAVILIFFLYQTVIASPASRRISKSAIKSFVVIGPDVDILCRDGKPEMQTI